MTHCSKFALTIILACIVLTRQSSCGIQNGDFMNEILQTSKKEIRPDPADAWQSASIYELVRLSLYSSQWSTLFQNKLQGARIETSITQSNIQIPSGNMKVWLCASTAEEVSVQMRRNYGWLKAVWKDQQSVKNFELRITFVPAMHELDIMSSGFGGTLELSYLRQSKISIIVTGIHIQDSTGKLVQRSDRKISPPYPRNTGIQDPIFKDHPILVSSDITEIPVGPLQTFWKSSQSICLVRLDGYNADWKLKLKNAIQGVRLDENHQQVQQSDIYLPAHRTYFLRFYLSVVTNPARKEGQRILESVVQVVWNKISVGICTASRVRGKVTVCWLFVQGNYERRNHILLSWRPSGQGLPRESHQIILSSFQIIGDGGQIIYKDITKSKSRPAHFGPSVTDRHHPYADHHAAQHPDHPHSKRSPISHSTPPHPPPAHSPPPQSHSPTHPQPHPQSTASSSMSPHVATAATVSAGDSSHHSSPTPHPENAILGFKDPMFMLKLIPKGLNCVQVSLKEQKYWQSNVPFVFMLLVSYDRDWQEARKKFGTTATQGVLMSRYHKVMIQNSIAVRQTGRYKLSFLASLVDSILTHQALAQGLLTFVNVYWHPSKTTTFKCEVHLTVTLCQGEVNISITDSNAIKVQLSQINNPKVCDIILTDFRIRHESQQIYLTVPSLGVLSPADQQQQQLQRAIALSIAQKDVSFTPAHHESNQEKQQRQFQEALRMSLANVQSGNQVSEALKVYLNGFSLQLHHVGGDGNCLYRAVASVQLGSQHRWRQVKNQIISQFLGHTAAYQSSILAAAAGTQDEHLPDSEKTRSYIAQVISDGAYGGEIELVAASAVYNSSFIVHKIDCRNGPDGKINGHIHVIDVKHPTVQFDPDKMFHLVLQFHGSLVDHWNSAVAVGSPLASINTQHFSSYFK